MERRKTLSLILAGISLLLLAVAAALSLGQGGPALPDELGGYALGRTASGPQAVEEITFLHIGDFEIVDGAVGEYGGGRVTVWAAEAGSKAEAGQLVLDMTSRIAEVESPFRPMGPLDRAGRAVYLLEGMEQVHFYFQAGELVIWAAADPALGELVLNQLLEFYP